MLLASCPLSFSLRLSAVNYLSSFFLRAITAAPAAIAAAAANGSTFAVSPVFTAFDPDVFEELLPLSDEPLVWLPVPASA